MNGHGLVELSLQVGGRLGIARAELEDLRSLASFYGGASSQPDVGVLAFALDAIDRVWAGRADVPRISSVVTVCDAYLSMTALPGDPEGARALEALHYGAGWRYDPVVVEALTEAVGAGDTGCTGAPASLAGQAPA